MDISEKYKLMCELSAKYFDDEFVDVEENMIMIGDDKTIKMSMKLSDATGCRKFWDKNELTYKSWIRVFYYNSLKSEHIKYSKFENGKVTVVDEMLGFVLWSQSQIQKFSMRNFNLDFAGYAEWFSTNLNGSTKHYYDQFKTFEQITLAHYMYFKFALVWKNNSWVSIT